MKKFLYPLLLCILFTVSLFGQYTDEKYEKYVGYARGKYPLTLSGLQRAIDAIEAVDSGVVNVAYPGVDTTGLGAFSNKVYLRGWINGIEIVGGATGGAGTWGYITGTLSNQTDLQNALNGKLDLADTSHKVKTSNLIYDNLPAMRDTLLYSNPHEKFLGTADNKYPISLAGLQSALGDLPNDSGTVYISYPGTDTSGLGAVPPNVTIWGWTAAYSSGSNGYESSVFQIETSASSSGNFYTYIDGITYTTVITSGDANTIIATKVYNTLHGNVPGWTISQNSFRITLTRNTYGNVTDPSYNATATGATVTIFSHTNGSTELYKLSYTNNGGNIVTTPIDNKVVMKGDSVGIRGNLDIDGAITTYDFTDGGLGGDNIIQFTSDDSLYLTVTLDNAAPISDYQTIIGQNTQGIYLQSRSGNGGYNTDAEIQILGAARDKIILDADSVDIRGNLDVDGAVRFYGGTGDVSGDGAIYSEDYSLIVDYLAGRVKLTEQQKMTADITGDGAVDWSDLMAYTRLQGFDVGDIGSIAYKAAKEEGIRIADSLKGTRSYQDFHVPNKLIVDKNVLIGSTDTFGLDSTVLIGATLNRESYDHGVFTAADVGWLARRRSSLYTLGGLKTDGQLYVGGDSSFFMGNLNVNGNFRVLGNILSYGSGQSPLNVAIGYNALGSSNSGIYNTAIGSGTLYRNTTGIRNTALGYQALFANTSGLNNVSIGVNSSLYLTEGGNNVMMGYAAGAYLDTNSCNTGVGSHSLHYNKRGSYNTAIGENSLYNLVSGNYNISIGNTPWVTPVDSLSLSNVIYIGSNILPSSTTATNEIVIGGSMTGAGNNTVILGNNSTTTTYLKGALSLEGSFITPTTTVSNSLFSNGFNFLGSNWIDYSSSSIFKLGKPGRQFYFNNGNYSDFWIGGFVTAPYNLPWIDNLAYEFRADYNNDTLKPWINFQNLLYIDGSGSPIWHPTARGRITMYNAGIGFGDLPDSVGLDWNWDDVTAFHVGIGDETNKTPSPTRFPMPVYGYRFRFGASGTQYYTYPKIYAFYSDFTSYGDQGRVGQGYHFYGKGNFPSYFGGSGEFVGTLKVGEITIPNTDGNAGDILTTDGSGNLSFQPNTVTVHNLPYVNNLLLPTSDDTISIFKTDTPITIDSIQVSTNDSLVIVGTFGPYGKGTTMFSGYTNSGGWHTITSFNDATIPTGNEVYFYFTYIGDALTYFRWKIYWREE